MTLPYYYVLLLATTYSVLLHVVQQKQVNAFLLPRQSFVMTNHFTNNIQQFYRSDSTSKQSYYYHDVGFSLLCLNAKNDNGKGGMNGVTNQKSSKLSSSQSIDELYKLAMEEDEEWFNSFVKDVLGDGYEGDIAIENLKSTTKEKEERSTPSVDKNSNSSNSNSNDKKWKVQKNRNENQILEGDFITKETLNGNSRKTKERNDMKRENQLNHEAISKERISKHNEQDNQVEEQDETPKSTSDDENNGYIINFVDMYNIEQKVPFSIISKLGYRASDVVKLRAEVLELIIEDDIPIPTNKDGLPQVPKRWKVDSKDNREVKILQKRRPPDDDNLHRDKRQKRVDVDDERTTKMRKKSSEGPKRRHRQSKREKKMKDSKSSSIWMDIPTFKQYLRREAELRLSILGPDWEEWVKGESDWRLNLYKGWLELIDEGFGDDIFEDISYAPPEMRSRSRSSIPMERRKRRIDDEEIGSPRKRLRRPMVNDKVSRQMKIRDEDYDYDDNNYFDDEYQNQPNRPRKRRSRVDEMDYQKSLNRNGKNPRSR